jgi:hypothetical protein
LFFEDGAYARFGDWALHQPLRIWPATLMPNQQV